MTVPTSLEAIAKKAKDQPKYKFRDLGRELKVELLRDSWGKLNKRSSVGIDGVSYREYDESLEANLESLISRLKSNSYKAKLVKRHYIPKGDGKQRPLGIPTTEDKLLQHSVAQILGAIYEQDFLPCSFGYRPNVGAKDAVAELQRVLTTEPYHWVVEADIRGFFDNIDHDQLLSMLEERIDDRRFLNLIRKWLKAGVLDTTGEVLCPTSGSPQGGVISPVLANIYMHHVLNDWFENVVKKHCKGRAYLNTYADDFVCAFENERDAELFYEVLPKRMGKFNLEIAPEKTSLIRFSRFGGEENGTFDYLGFRFKWVKSRTKGSMFVQTTTSKKKFNNSIKNLNKWCNKFRDTSLDILMMKLNRKLTGYYNYYARSGNLEMVWKFHYIVGLSLFKYLNRRSQKSSYTWQGFNDLLKDFPLVTPRIKW